MAQIILNHPKSVPSQPFSCQLHPLIPGLLANSVGGPEKAGVGGSIPSLATMFSITCRPSGRQFHSISFQLNGAGRFASSENAPPDHCRFALDSSLIPSANRSPLRRCQMSAQYNSGRGGCYLHPDSERFIHCDRCLACLGQRPRWWLRAVFSGGRHYCCQCAPSSDPGLFIGG